MENIFSTPITKQNTSLLASLSVRFFATNGIKFTQEMMDAFADATMTAIEAWYRTNKDREFNALIELVEEDAVKYAFNEMQEIVTLARSAVMLGISTAELGIA